MSTEKEVVDFATVYLKGTNRALAATADAEVTTVGVIMWRIKYYFKLILKV